MPTVGTSRLQALPTTWCLGSATDFINSTFETCKPARLARKHWTKWRGQRRIILCSGNQCRWRYVAFTTKLHQFGSWRHEWPFTSLLCTIQSGTTTLASIGIGGQANQNCYSVSISADGHHVAFDSSATNLVAQPTNSKNNVYVIDWQTGTVTLVSVDSAGQLGNSDSYSPTISATGRYVAFESYSSNLGNGDSNGSEDVFLRDLQTGITKRISVGSAGEGDSDSFFPSISAHGRSVVFNSYADNLVSGFNVHNFGDIYLYFNSLAVTDSIHITGDLTRTALSMGPITSFCEKAWEPHIRRMTTTTGALTLARRRIVVLDCSSHQHWQKPTFSVTSNGGEGQVNDASTLEKQQLNAQLLDAQLHRRWKSSQAMSADDHTQASRDKAAEGITARSQASS